MATHACRTVAMDGESLLNSQILQLGFLAVELRHIGRWRRRRVVEQIPKQPYATLDRMAILAVRKAGKDTCVSEDAAAVQTRVELYLAEPGIRNARDAVMGCQDVIDAREVGVQELE